MRGSIDIEENLDMSYEDCVIGGPAAFVVPIHERKQFIEGDAHQVGAGGFPAAEARPRACLPISADKTAHLLHHRRKDVAGVTGARGFDFR